MATVARRNSNESGLETKLLSLHSGDRLSQAEFHRRYRAYPDDVKFELIGGIVYMASPVGRPHAIYHLELAGILFTYKSSTAGVEGADNASIILEDESEPQPDLSLRVLPEFGGRSKTTEDEYICGPPELLAEVAHTSVAIDLHAKKTDYQRAGVLEYAVLCIEEQQLRWFDLVANQELPPDADGVFRSKVFPGLWIDVAAVLARDTARALAVLQQGIASPEHAEFVKILELQKGKPAKVRSSKSRRAANGKSTSKRKKGTGR